MEEAQKDYSKCPKCGCKSYATVNFALKGWRHRCNNCGKDWPAFTKKEKPHGRYT